MTAPTANAPKPLVNNQLIRGHLLALAERLGAHQDDESAHVSECLTTVLDATWGPKI